jgi:hypothetical protein
MDAITGYVSANPEVLVIGVILIVILLLHFIFKSMIKLLLVILLISLVAFGYYYFKDPGEMPGKVKKSVEMMNSSINELTDKSKSFVKDSKDLYNKSKDVPKDINKLIDASDKESEKDFKK